MVATLAAAVTTSTQATGTIQFMSYTWTNGTLQLWIMWSSPKGKSTFSPHLRSTIDVDVSTRTLYKAANGAL